MMSHSNKQLLHELLSEDQEPFHLRTYISERKSQLKKTPQRKPKQPPLLHATSLHKSCFSSFHQSPDFSNPPIIKSPKSIRLQVPARTASSLFESAAKIQKQNSRRTQIRNLGFGLFGSILKRLSAKTRARTCEIGNPGGGSESKDFSRGVSAISCSCEGSSGVWSAESNEEEDKSTVDLESSTNSGSGSSCNFEEFCGAFAYNCDDDKHHFSSISPMSPFRFALQRCPSPGQRTPVFSSPATSPSHNKLQENESKSDEEEDQEKEQSSPVSVLDPPFQDDDDDDAGDNEDGDDEDSYKLECTYEFVQRAKQQLLHKLRRFERLAELDPIELEKRMWEEQDEEHEQEEEHEESIDTKSSKGDSNELREIVDDVLSQSDVSEEMKKFVFDLVKEEKNRENIDNDMVAKMVRKRLGSWNEVQQNTIDMMVEFDFRRESDNWKGNSKEGMEEIAFEIEVSMFAMLVEELTEELLY